LAMMPARATASAAALNWYAQASGRKNLSRLCSESQGHQGTPPCGRLRDGAEHTPSRHPVVILTIPIHNLAGCFKDRGNLKPGENYARIGLDLR
jgi:hypothetical protein